MSGQHVPATQITANDSVNTGRLAINGDSVQEIINNLDIKTGEAITTAELAAALPADLLSLWPTLLDEVTVTIDGNAAVGSRTGRRYDLTLALGAVTSAQLTMGNDFTNPSLTITGSEITLTRRREPTMILSTGGSLPVAITLPYDGTTLVCPANNPSVHPDFTANYSSVNHRFTTSLETGYRGHTRASLRTITPGTGHDDDTFLYYAIYERPAGVGTALAVQRFRWGDRVLGEDLRFTTFIDNIYLDPNSIIEHRLVQLSSNAGADRYQLWATGLVLYAWR
jgi:hypothetical protein